MMDSLPEWVMSARIGREVLAVPFAGAGSGPEPLTWGQKAIWQDMQASGNQFTMFGMAELPEDSTVNIVADRLAGLVGRHASLRMRLGTGNDGRPYQDIAEAGQLDLLILTLPDDTGEDGVSRFIDQLWRTWHLERIDFYRDWPLRMAVVKHRGACVSLVWAFSHLAADGGGHMLFFREMVAEELPGEPPAAQVADVARNEQTEQLRQLSKRTMRYWEGQLRHIPAQTFGEAVRPSDEEELRYWQARFSSPAAHLAMLAIAERTGSDSTQVTLAVLAIAIGRATGVNPLTIKVMVNNRFRPGLGDVIAPIAQNTVVTIDLSDSSVDEVVRRTRAASLSAGMRAYYDPDDLNEVMARLDTERGYPATVTCRINDQRAMVAAPRQEAGSGDLTPEQVKQKLADTSLTWLGPKFNMHEQANILVENRPGVVSLHMMWDGWSLTREQVEVLLRGVEEVAVAAAFDPAAPAMRSGHDRLVFSGAMRA
jgi:hypothetical protein